VLRRLGRFVLYQLSPANDSGGVKPASITYRQTGAAEPRGAPDADTRVPSGAPRAGDPERPAPASDAPDPFGPGLLEHFARRWRADARRATGPEHPLPDIDRRPLAMVEQLPRDSRLRGQPHLLRLLEALLSAGAPLDARGRPDPTPRIESTAGASPEGLRPGTSLELLRARRTDVVACRRPRRRRRRLRLAGHRIGAVALVAGAALAAMGVVATTGLGGAEPAHRAHRSGGSADLPRRVAAVGAPFPSDGDPRYPTARLRGGAALYDRPGGRPMVKVPSRTEWGSPEILSVVGQRGDWLAVLAPQLRNHVAGWLPPGRATMGSVRYALRVDLSQRELLVRRGGRTIRRVRVAIGAPGTPTPTGRFAVTDKLEFTPANASYGCCALVLSAHQRRLPPGWPGGDRVAVHSTPDASSIGRSASLGCLRASFADARWLMNAIPLGTPVFIGR
jgi:hypothetical protein